MLNKDQKRRLSISLRIVEENIQDIEQILHNGAYTGILYDVNCDVSPKVKEEILKKVTLIKDKIKSLSRKFTLEKEYKEARKKIFDKLSSCWEIMEGVKTKRLKKYGTVSHELDNVLDPQLNIIIDLISETEHLVLGKAQTET